MFVQFGADVVLTDKKSLLKLITHNIAANASELSKLGHSDSAGAESKDSPLKEPCLAVRELFWGDPPVADPAGLRTCAFSDFARTQFPLIGVPVPHALAQSTQRQEEKVLSLSTVSFCLS